MVRRILCRFGSGKKRSTTSITLPKKQSRSAFFSCTVFAASKIWPRLRGGLYGSKRSSARAGPCTNMASFAKPSAASAPWS